MLCFLGCRVRRLMLGLRRMVVLLRFVGVVVLVQASHEPEVPLSCTVLMLRNTKLDLVQSRRLSRLVKHVQSDCRLNGGW